MTTEYRLRGNDLRVIGTSQLLLQLPVASFTVVMATGIGVDRRRQCWAGWPRFHIAMGGRGDAEFVRRTTRGSHRDPLGSRANCGHWITLNVLDAFSVVVALTVTVVAFAPQLTAWALVFIWGM